jgi:hypothetical protein
VRPAALFGFLFLLGNMGPARADSLECLEGFANIGLAGDQSSAFDGAGFHANGGMFCDFGNHPVALRGLAGFAQFRSSADPVDIRTRTWFLEAGLIAELIQKAHVYGTAGIGAYYTSLDPAPPGSDAHGIHPGYNAGISVAFPIGDGPGIATELMWRNVAGPDSESFFTLTIGIGGL